MTSPSLNNFLVAGRRVKIVRGTASQTVNICTPANEIGTYETTYRLSLDVPVDGAELAALADLEALGRSLKGRGAQSEVPGKPGARALTSVKAPPADDAWVVEAQAAVDAAISTLVRQFLEQPYLHRVEHSLHTLLHRLLTEHRRLSEVVPLVGGQETQLIQKEWPETVARPSEKGTRKRGSFDIAILSPAQVRAATLEQFEEGRIDAPIVIEVGLDYGQKHLQDDMEKLRNSRVPVPYLLHLSRLPIKTAPIVEAELAKCTPPLRAAYAHVDTRAGKRRVKHLGDAAPSD